jgi:hypothetical protein
MKLFIIFLLWSELLFATARIVGFVDHKNPRWVKVLGQESFQVGSILHVYRTFSGGERALVGEVKVVENLKDADIAEINLNLTSYEVTKYPFIMVGDEVEEKKLLIVNTAQILPEMSLLYNKIFKFPKSNPQNYDLSESGRKYVGEKLSIFMPKRFSILLIQGFTDQAGSLELNRLESKERAESLRRYLIEELGFDSRRVVAVGLGEAELVDTSQVLGEADRNRRLVLKVISYRNQREFSEAKD